MWNIISEQRDTAFDRWQNTSIDDFMAYRLGEIIPGPDGFSRGWRIWAEGKRLLCERKEAARDRQDMLNLMRTFSARRQKQMVGQTV